jgi:GTP-binding protein
VEDVPGADRPTRIAIVGRPNVGKSSLINALINDERTIVSNIAGTTRDAVDVEFQVDDRRYVLIDTAGIRSRKRRKSSVEVFSAMRSEKSIRRADLCVLVIDAADGPTAQDQKIAGIIKEERKPCLIVCNKFDLIESDLPFRELVDELQGVVSAEMHFVDYARTIFLSALKKQRINQLLKAVEMVELESKQRIGTGILNRMVTRAMELNPPPTIKRRRFRVLYVTQIQPRRPRPINPAEFLLFCNSKDLLTPQYERYLERKLREKYHFRGLPVIFHLRSREKRGDGEK